ncbi:MAG TPA: ABC transporter ATP-binding protein [Rhodocyclaceae bacterium]
MSAAISISHLSKTYRMQVGGADTERTLKSALLTPFRYLTHGRPVAETPTFRALDDVTFDIQDGEAFGLIGHNGAGKSTLLKILSRITTPSSGRVTVRGRVGSLLEVGTGFHPELSGRENIHLAGAIQGMTPSQIRRHFDEIVVFSEIEDFLHLPVKHYSSGMYMKLAFSVAAHMEPDILLVDEALAVGDVRFQRKCLARMHELVARSSVVVLVSHNHESISSFCHRAAWLNHGKLAMIGDSGDVVAHYLDAMRSVRPTIRWEGNAGDDTLRLLTTYVRHPDDAPLDTAGELIIGFRAEILQPVVNLVAAVEIRSERGTVLAYSACDDALPPPAEEVAVGVFSREVRIPAHTFASGVYEVNFDFGIHNERRIIDGPGALMFELKNSCGYGRRFPGGRSGLFRPAWRWQEADRP